MAYPPGKQDAGAGVPRCARWGADQLPHAIATTAWVAGNSEPTPNQLLDIKGGPAQGAHKPRIRMGVTPRAGGGGCGFKHEKTSLVLLPVSLRKPPLSHGPPHRPLSHLQDV